MTTFPAAQIRFEELVRAPPREEGRRFVLAELNDLLNELAAAELPVAVAEAPIEGLSPYLQNYVAAMVERASERKQVAPAAWTRDIVPLEEPVLATELPGLRIEPVAWIEWE